LDSKLLQQNILNRISGLELCVESKRRRGSRARRTPRGCGKFRGTRLDRI